MKGPLTGEVSKKVLEGLQQSAPQIPLFMRTDWMRAVHARDAEWGVVLAGSEHDPKGFLPFSIRYRYGLRLIGMPPLTPYGGPYLYYPEEGRRDYEMQVVGELIDGLPSFHEFDQKFHPQMLNWFPFYTRGFRETTLYTNILSPAASLDQIRQSYSSTFRNRLKKLEESSTVLEDQDPLPLLELHKAEQEKRRIPQLFDRETLERIDALLAPCYDRKILYAYDEKGENLLGGVYLAKDRNSCYYLLGSSDPDQRRENPLGRLLYEGHKWGSDLNLPLDLLGSMVPSIERAHRRMRPDQVPHHRVYKRRGAMIELLRSFQGKTL